MAEKIMFFLFFLSCFFTLSVLAGFVKSVYSEEKYEIGDVRLSLFWASLSFISTVIATGFSF